ncbi:MAG TPA: hypothetical protein VD788_03370 [Candidatus Polarisedimenticolaceae bacterium]|nr:hypothetical protein [Candidatus Polarisedimenticolaceae bacterium]
MAKERFAVFLAVLCLATGWVDAQVLLQLTDLDRETALTPALDDAGEQVFANVNADAFGGNPGGVFQLGAWNAVTGIGSALVEDPDGVSWMRRSVAVSADGEWLAFVSPADLTGQNHDEGLEIFVIQPDGSGLAQLTNHVGPANTSWIYRVAISGNGDRVAFIADTDPLGANPDRVPQVFAVDRDGSSPIQLTAATSADQSPGSHWTGTHLDVDISDAGTVVLFHHAPGLFVILDDGSGLQPVEGGIFSYLSGNGLHAASEMNSSAVVVDPWMGFIELSEQGSSPSITADGSFVYFSDNRIDPSDNPEGNDEIWQASLDGSIVAAVTSTTGRSNVDPVVSGDGTRIAFYQRWTTDSLRAIDFRGDNEVVLAELTGDDPYVFAPEITPDGSRIVYSLSGGGMLRVDPADGEHQLVVPFEVEAKSITADGETIVFQAYEDPLGIGNDLGNPQVYAVEADGTGLRVLSGPFVPGQGAFFPVIAANGSWVVFVGLFDQELYRVRPDGSEFAKFTNLAGSGNFYPRIDANGEWVVFENQGIARIRTDGSGFQQIVSAGLFETHWPDISGSGQQIVWAGSNDPLGTNPDGNSEIFRYDVQAATIDQVTVTTVGSSSRPRISKDGNWIYFNSSVPFFDENPQRRHEPYRYEIASGTIERVGGIRRGPTDLACSLVDPDCNMAVDGTGRRAVFTAAGDWAGANPDYGSELYLVDQQRGSRIEAGKSAPSVVTWDADPRYVRYDIVRGDLANVGYDDGTIALGPVTCLEQVSPDTDTRGFEDELQPAPGQVLVYVYRGTQGTGAAVGDWGVGTGGFTRVPGTGSCGP